MTVCAAERCKLTGELECPSCGRLLCRERHLQDGWEECQDCRRAHASHAVCATPECDKTSVERCPTCCRWRCKEHRGRPTTEACAVCEPEQVAARGGG